MQCVLVLLAAMVAVAMAGGKCSRDGFFYNDGKSFTICSNGNSYVQPCAPGTRNSGKYRAGGYAKSAHSFCDVNLVDHGYAVAHGYKGKHTAGYSGYNAGYNHGNAGYNRGYNNGYHGNAYGAYNNGYGYQGNAYGAYNNGYGYGNNNYGYSGYGAGFKGPGYAHANRVGPHYG